MPITTDNQLFLLDVYKKHKQIRHFQQIRAPSLILQSVRLIGMI